MKPELLKGLDFTTSEVNDAIKEGKVLSFDLELSRICNLRCRYCYAESGKGLKNELNFKEICEVIDQCKSLGAKKCVVIGGGEPLLYNNLFRVLEYILSKNLSIVLFTNGTLLNYSNIKFLFNKRIDLAIKLNSFREETQDYLAGSIKGTYRKIIKNLNLLLDIGYSKPGNPKLAIETIICNQNYNEIFNIYKFCRENMIIPYIEILTVQGRAKENKNMVISSLDAYNLFKRINEYDRNEWGYQWEITPPIVGQNCKRMFYSVYIVSNGNVQPCPGIDIEGGNIRNDKISLIIKNSKIFNDVRNIKKLIKGKCFLCKFNNICYGCRGAALHHSGNYLNSDPTCWYLEGVSYG